MEPDGGVGVSRIQIEFSDATLTCLGSVSLPGAEPVSAGDDGALRMDCREGFVLEVVDEGQILMDDQVHGLLPGEYQVTSDGVTKDGVPIAATD
jgi:hypothetical protein